MDVAYFHTLARLNKVTWVEEVMRLLRARAIEAVESRYIDILCEAVDPYKPEGWWLLIDPVYTNAVPSTISGLTFTFDVDHPNGHMYTTVSYDLANKQADWHSHD